VTRSAQLLDAGLDRALMGYSSVGYAVRHRRWAADDPPPGALRDKLAVVTGARSGIGKAVAIGLAHLGARVVMVVRDREAAHAARAEVVARVPGAAVDLEEADVSALASVRELAVRLDTPVDVLVHNAGVMPPSRQVTAEGNELTLATHVLGPHLLTRRLAPRLAETGAGRVIWVSSGGMYAQRLDLEDLENERRAYRPTDVYARTKRMQVVLAGEWARRLGGEEVDVHAMHPGWVDTPGLSSSLPWFRRLTRPLLRTPAQGADTIVWLAASPEPQGHGGRLWHDRAERPEHYLSRTRETAAERRALWDACERLTDG
jgi:dehydrogenase/reductase SDR family member 12